MVIKYRIILGSVACRRIPLADESCPRKDNYCFARKNTVFNNGVISTISSCLETLTAYF
jgi:hypothetical protein